jgi:hypothetical protein
MSSLHCMVLNEAKGQLDFLTICVLISVLYIYIKFHLSSFNVLLVVSVDRRTTPKYRFWADTML